MGNFRGLKKDGSVVKLKVHRNDLINKLIDLQNDLTSITTILKTGKEGSLSTKLVENDNFSGLTKYTLVA